jgi:hypothetical protein
LVPFQILPSFITEGSTCQFRRPDWIFHEKSEHMMKRRMKLDRPPAALPKCPTGIPGLDDITNGRLPRGRVPPWFVAAPDAARRFQRQVFDPEQLNSCIGV